MQAEAPSVKLSDIQMWNNDKRLQTQVCIKPAVHGPVLVLQDMELTDSVIQVTDVADDTITIRSLDWDRDRFDIEFG